MKWCGMTYIISYGVTSQGTMHKLDGAANEVLHCNLTDLIRLCRPILFLMNDSYIL